VPILTLPCFSSPLLLMLKTAVFVSIRRFSAAPIVSAISSFLMYLPPLRGCVTYSKLEGMLEYGTPDVWPQYVTGKNLGLFGQLGVFLKFELAKSSL